jgi:hypothetical protein
MHVHAFSDVEPAALVEYAGHDVQLFAPAAEYLLAAHALQPA